MHYWISRSRGFGKLKDKNVVRCREMSLWSSNWVQQRVTDYYSLSEMNCSSLLLLTKLFWELPKLGLCTGHHYHHRKMMQNARKHVYNERQRQVEYSISCFYISELVLWSVPTILEMFHKQCLGFNLCSCAFRNELFRYFIVYYASAWTSNFYCKDDINMIISWWTCSLIMIKAFLHSTWLVYERLQLIKFIWNMMNGVIEIHSFN
jgi:hypothetical protein